MSHKYHLQTAEKLTRIKVLLPWIKQEQINYSF